MNQATTAGRNGNLMSSKFQVVQNMLQKYCNTPNFVTKIWYRRTLVVCWGEGVGNCHSLSFLSDADTDSLTSYRQLHRVVSIGVFLSLFVHFLTIEYVSMYLSFLLVAS